MAALRAGSRGTRVRELQLLLNKVGFEVVVDGIFGRGTDKAVRRFQRSAGLQVDGLAGNNTMQALRMRVREAEPSAPPPAVANGALLDPEQLPRILNRASRSAIAKYAVSIDDAMRNYDINTALRIAHFLAQVGHESGHLRFNRENLNYRSVGRIRAVFPKYFRDLSDAQVQAYVRNPQRLGSRVYANRMQNGDEQSGDGFRFRGRGLIQLTGKANYRQYGNFLGIDLTTEETADRVAQPELAADVAGWFWMKRELNQAADQGGDEAIVTITRKINGGLNGLDDRRELYERAGDVLGV